MPRALITGASSELGEEFAFALGFTFPKDAEPM